MEVLTRVPPWLSVYTIWIVFTFKDDRLFDTMLIYQKSSSTNRYKTDWRNVLTRNRHRHIPGLNYKSFLVLKPSNIGQVKILDTVQTHNIITPLFNSTCIIDGFCYSVYAISLVFFIVSERFVYFVFQDICIGRTWWRLFKKHVLCAQ